MRHSEFLKIAKQIEKVEDSDPNFVKNPKWQFLRQKQNKEYIDLANSQIAHHKAILERYNGETADRFKRECDKSREQIKFCEEFLKLFDPKIEKIMYGDKEDEPKEKSKVL